MNKDSITIIGDPKTSNPVKGIAPHPLYGYGNIRNVDVTTNPGSIRLNNLLEKKSGSVVTGQITWQRVDPVSGNIFAIDANNLVYVSTDSGATWQLIGKGDGSTSATNGVGIGQGLEIWKGYLITTSSTKLDAFGPVAGSNGTGTISSVGTAVTGSGTSFSTQAVVGNIINVGNQFRIVTARASDTALTINAAFSPDISGQNFTYYKWTRAFTSMSLSQTQNQSFCPIFKSIDNKIYIGNGKFVSSLAEATTFDPTSSATWTEVAAAITLADNYIVNTIRELGSNLMLGTLFAQSNTIADIFPYDRTTLTLGIPIRIAEKGIQAMYVFGNRLYALAGTTGKLFITDTVSATQIAQLPNYLVSYDAGAGVTIYPDAIMYQKGRLYFGIGNTSGSSAVWSYHIANKSIQIENTISTGNDGSSGGAVLISSLQPTGLDTFLVGWSVNATTYGIDKINDSLRYTSYAGYAESALVKVGEALANRTIPQLEMALIKPLVSGQGVVVKWRKDLTSSYTTLITLDFATYGAIQAYNVSAATLTSLVLLQIRVELTTGAVNTSPELQSVILHPGN